MSKSPLSHRFPVTVTRLPVTRCQVCHHTVAYRPGAISEALTEHYRRAHPKRSTSRPGNHPAQSGSITADGCRCGMITPAKRVGGSQ
jgi:hypothetical protein